MKINEALNIVEDKIRIDFEENTAEQYITYIKEFVIYFGDKHIKAIRHNEVQEYLSNYKQTKKDSTIRPASSALATFFKYCLQYNLIRANPVHGIDIKQPDDPLPHPLSEQEISIFKIKTKNNIRDRLIIEILLTTGVKNEEAINIEVGDIDFERSCIIVREKKKKKRTLMRREIPVSKECLEMAIDYMEYRGEQHSPKLFITRFNEGFTTRGLSKLVKEYAKEAEISNVTLQRFRDTFAVNLVKQGYQIKKTAALLGISDLNKVKKYYKH